MPPADPMGRDGPMLDEFLTIYRSVDNHFYFLIVHMLNPYTSTHVHVSLVLIFCDLVEFILSRVSLAINLDIR